MEERREKERRKEKKNEEERKGRGGKGKRKMKECHAVSRPRHRRTRNCATRGRFPPTPVIVRLGATQWPNGFTQFQGKFKICVVWLLLCDGQRPVSKGFVTVCDRTLSETEGKIPSRMTNGGVPKFLHTNANRSRQLRTTITFLSEL